MQSVHVLAGVLILFFAGASFFFALAETALFSLSKWQVRRLAERNPRTGGIVSQLLSEPQDLLATMVLGNTFATASMLAIAFWMALRERWPTVPTVIALFILILFGCEVLPKTLAVRRPEKWSTLVAGPMRVLEHFAYFVRRAAQQLNSVILRATIVPAAAPLAGLSNEEYQELLELAHQQGTIEENEKEIILRIIQLDRRTAKEVMKPRAQMACIPDDLSIEDMIAASRAHRHRRLPIYDETPDTIVGILNTRALLLDPSVDLADAIEFPSFVPETMNLLVLLKSLQRQQRGMAIVLDEFGGTAGIVTTEDIIEEVVGKIRTEMETETFVMEKLGANRWRVNGTMRLDDFQREYPPLGDVPDVETMGGLLMTLLDVVPEPGQSIVFRGVKLTALVTDERRVRELLVEAVR